MEGGERARGSLSRCPAEITRRPSDREYAGAAECECVEGARDVLEADQTVAILEAMELEINVKPEKEHVNRRMEMVAVKPGDSVVA